MKDIKEKEDTIVPMDDIEKFTKETEKELLAQLEELEENQPVEELEPPPEVKEYTTPIEKLPTSDKLDELSGYSDKKSAKKSALSSKEPAKKEKHSPPQAIQKFPCIVKLPRAVFNLAAQSLAKKEDSDMSPADFLVENAVSCASGKIPVSIRMDKLQLLSDRPTSIHARLSDEDRLMIEAAAEELGLNIMQFIAACAIAKIK